MKRLLFIISDIDKALPFEWLADGLKEDFHLHFILLNPGESALGRYLDTLQLPYDEIPATSYLKLWGRLRKRIRQLRPDIVHCHLRRAEIAGITASYFAGVKHRLYTRHSSTFNHLYHPKGVWVDKRINLMSTGIIAISENVKEILTKWENVPSSKIHLIRHGFDLKMFGEVSGERTNRLREKYNLQSGHQVIGVIARYTKWKGFETIIPAFSEYLEYHPDSVFVFANARGEDENQIRTWLGDYLPTENIREIGYEEDVAALYKLMDMYIHVPIDPEVEAFGQTYVEALASGVPSIFTLSGIAREFIKDGYNALTVPFNDSKALTRQMIYLNENPPVREQLTINGRESVQSFDLPSYLQALKRLYTDLE